MHHGSARCACTGVQYLCWVYTRSVTGDLIFTSIQCLQLLVELERSPMERVKQIPVTNSNR